MPRKSTTTTTRKTTTKTKTTTKSGGGWLSKKDYHSQSNQLKGEIRFIKVQTLGEKKRGEEAVLRGTTHWANTKENWADTQAVKEETSVIKLELAHENKAIAQNQLSVTRQKSAVLHEEWKHSLGELTLDIPVPAMAREKVKA